MSSPIEVTLCLSSDAKDTDLKATIRNSLMTLRCAMPEVDPTLPRYGTDLMTLRCEILRSTRRYRLTALTS